MELMGFEKWDFITLPSKYVENFCGSLLLLLLFLYFLALFVSGWEKFMKVVLDFYLLLYTTSSLSFCLGFGENIKTARFGFCETKPFGEGKRFLLHSKN
jgi:hypothetical protein